MYMADIVHLTSDAVQVSGTNVESKIVDYNVNSDIYRVLMNMDGGDPKTLRICFDGYPQYGYHVFVLVLQEGVELVQKYITDLS